MSIRIWSWVFKWEKNGKGKEYWNNNNLKFEGEYLNDLEWNGNGYNKFGNAIYELKNGKGLIKQYKEDYEDNVEEDENCD